MLALFHGADVVTEVEQVMAEFPKLCVHEPTNDMFVDPQNPQNNNKAVKPNSQFDIFSRSARYAFEDWSSYGRVTGMGVIFEPDPTLTEHVYEGKAAFVPIPMSYDPVTKPSFAFAVQCSAEDADNLPALTENDHVEIKTFANATVGGNDQKRKGYVSEPN